MPTIQERVINSIASIIAGDKSLITVDKTYEQLGVDSLEIIEIIFELEDEFEIIIEENDDDSDNFRAANFTTVGQTIKFIEDKLRVKA